MQNFMDSSKERLRLWDKAAISIFVIALCFGCIWLLPQFDEATPTALSEGQVSVAAQPNEQLNDRAQFDYEQFDYEEPESLPPRCGGLTQEAEDGRLSGYFTVGTDPQASGGRFVHVMQGWGDRFAGLDDAHRVSFCVEIAAAGLYQLRAATQAHGASNNSLYVTVDGAPTGGYIWDVQDSAQFVDGVVSDAVLGTPLQLNLEAGRHTLSFYLREDDTRLDKFALEPMVAAASMANAVVNQARISGTGISGSVQIDAGHAWLPKLAEAKKDDLRVTIVDTETQGNTYQSFINTSSDGTYLVDELSPGVYTVSLDVPFGHFAIGPASMTVVVEDAQMSLASFDLLLLDDNSHVSNEEAPAAGNNLERPTDATSTNATETPRLYLPLVEQ